MATLRLSNLGDGYVRWTISGLSNDFTTANGYISAGITMYQFTQSTPSISGIVSEVYAGASGTKTVTGTEYVGAGRHQFWAFTQGSGMYYPAGSASVTITEGPDRPSDWAWWWDVVPGARLPTAMEWDGFCDRINEFRAYKGLSQYAFTKTYPGPTTFKAAMVNQAINAIKQMSPPIAPPALTVAGATKLSAALLNGLSRSLNSIT